MRACDLLIAVTWAANNLEARTAAEGKCAQNVPIKNGVRLIAEVNTAACLPYISLQLSASFFATLQ